MTTIAPTATDAIKVVYKSLLDEPREGVRSYVMGALEMMWPATCKEAQVEWVTGAHVVLARKPITEAQQRIAIKTACEALLVVGFEVNASSPVAPRITEAIYALKDAFPLEYDESVVELRI